MPDIERLKAALADIFGDRVSDSAAICEHHGADEGYHHALPDLVIFPLSTQEVSKAVQICADFDCPITAWGVGTSLEGNALAVQGGACLDLSRMDAVIDIRAEDMTVTVQPGVRRRQLDAELRDTGLFFPIDPGADATLGGMAATRASGTNAVRYGTMRGNVVCCTVVLADGRIIETGRNAPKSAAGYDLTALFVGSEGTLGIITELTVRLYPVPERTTAMICAFDSVNVAVAAVVDTIQSALGVARIELLDSKMMEAINRYEKADFLRVPTLFVEFHGADAVVDMQIGRFADIVSEHAGQIVQTATLTEDRARLWKARHNALYASKAMAPGKKALITDVCVPISRLAACIAETRAELDASPLTATIAGHVGDGNFHAIIMIDPDHPEEREAAEALHVAMARRAIAMGGTCTGEHGIGLGKRELLAEEAGEAVAVMRAIKQALDPKGLFNPGKIFL